MFIEINEIIFDNGKNISSLKTFTLIIRLWLINNVCLFILLVVEKILLTMIIRRKERSRKCLSFLYKSQFEWLSMRKRERERVIRVHSYCCSSDGFSWSTSDCSLVHSCKRKKKEVLVPRTTWQMDIFTVILSRSSCRIRTLSENQGEKSLFPHLCYEPRSFFFYLCANLHRWNRVERYHHRRPMKEIFE